MPETLLESELFGHERGAFTGAARQRAGLFERADGGTLFLDEIGEMPPAMQVKLLRVLQERRGPPRRRQRARSVDVRVIAATNAICVEADAARRASARISSTACNVFAMRAAAAARAPRGSAAARSQALHRRVRRAASRKSIAAVDAGAMRMLEQHDWPGNVRELRNVIERADDARAGPVHRAAAPAADVCSTRTASPQQAAGRARRRAHGRGSRARLIMMTLEHTRDNKTRAAEILGISLKTLHNKLNKLRLRPRRNPEP